MDLQATPLDSPDTPEEIGWCWCWWSTHGSARKRQQRPTIDALRGAGSCRSFIEENGALDRISIRSMVVFAIDGWRFKGSGRMNPSHPYGSYGRRPLYPSAVRLSDNCHISLDRSTNNRAWRHLMHQGQCWELPTTSLPEFISIWVCFTSRAMEIPHAAIPLYSHGENPLAHQEAQMKVNLYSTSDPGFDLQLSIWSTILVKSTNHDPNFLYSTDQGRAKNMEWRR